MNIPISNRLLACCGFIPKGVKVADIGTDHGYLGIYLLKNNLASHVIAADVSKSPLTNAFHNAHRFGVADRMTFCLSDGLQAVPRDFQVAVLAGMGADTILGILGAAPWLRLGPYRLVLQCQTQRHLLRSRLGELGFRISRETLARDGRFLYPVIEAVPGETQPLTPGQCYLSPALLERGSALLPEFYERTLQNLVRTVEGLERSQNPRDAERMPFYRKALEELKELEDKIL